jgi:heme-degrading monooxygenase HmoA
MHLAELNLARLKHPIGDPRVAEFVDNLGRVNEAGKRMPGFVWILEDMNGTATNFRIDDDPQMLVNLTVWESAEHLKRFVFGPVHAHFMNRRHLWLDALEGIQAVFWPVAPGHYPTLEEATQRLAHLRKHGSGDYAWSAADVFGATSTPPGTGA